MNERKDDFKIILTIKQLKNDDFNLSLECSKENIEDTSLVEQLYFDVIKHVVCVVNKQDINDKYFDLEKFINDDETLTVKCIINKLKED